MSVAENVAELRATLLAHLKECGDKSQNLTRTLDQINRGMELLHTRISSSDDKARADRKQDIDGVLHALREERDSWQTSLKEERSKRENIAWWAITSVLAVAGSIIITLLAVIAFFLTGGRIEMGTKAAATFVGVM